MVQPKFKKLTQCQSLLSDYPLHKIWYEKVIGEMVGSIKLSYMYIQVFNQGLH